jgi:D-alanyl-D-alanine carboxypeptidase
MKSPQRKLLSLGVAIGVLTLTWLPPASAQASGTDTSVQEQLDRYRIATGSVGAMATVRVGMPSTFYPRAGEKDLPAPAVRGYLSVAGVPFADVTNFEPAVWGAAAALVSDGRDMTRFVNALLNGQVVSQARLTDMEQTLPVTGVGDYGLGLVALKTSCGIVWGHTGEVAGYSSLTYATGRRAISVVVNNTPVVSDGATATDATTRLINQTFCE